MANMRLTNIDKLINDFNLALLDLFRSKRDIRLHDEDVKRGRDGYVYLIFSGKYTKIGCSSKPKERIKSILGSSPFKVYYYSVYFVSNYLNAEYEMHEAFKEKRTNGEWFELDDDDFQFAEILLQISHSGRLAFHGTRGI